MESDVRHSDFTAARFKSETLVSVYDQINVLGKQNTDLEKSLSSLNEAIRLSAVYANVDGKVQELNVFNKDDYVPAGSALLRLVPDSGETAVTEIMVPNSKIAHIHKGLKVSFEMASLPKSEYGTISGTIVGLPTFISSDSIMNQLFFVLEKLDFIKCMLLLECLYRCSHPYPSRRHPRVSRNSLMAWDSEVGPRLSRVGFPAFGRRSIRRLSVPRRR